MPESYVMNGVPSVRRRRTRFTDNWGVTTSMSVGKLYPIQWQEVLPGDDFDESLSLVIRQTSPYIRTPMENLVLDVYAFFVPGRILQDGYESIFGNPNPSQYVTPALGNTPCFNNSITVTEKSVADYLGLPVGTITGLNSGAAPMPEHITVLPFRAFASIYNEYFRDENNVDEVLISRADSVQSGEAINGNAWSATNYTGLLPNVKKIPDYFNTCVRSPQKGNAVVVPIVNGSSVPVVGLGAALHPSYTMRFGVAGASLSGPLSLDAGVLNCLDGSPVSGTTEVRTTNLGVNLANSNVGIDVDSLRLSLQRQLMLYTDTIYGSRYREYILGHYGVQMRDERAQVPEYLCGKRIPLNQQDVPQTSATAAGSTPLGYLSSYSYTSDGKSARYWKGFAEHGYVFWVGCLRYRHTYQQGVARKWMRFSRDDFFDPLYSHIGYQPVYARELFYNLGSGFDDVFGYGEAWREYVRTPDIVTGECRSKTSAHSAGYNSLDMYHFADVYANTPIIGKQFVEESSSNIDRTISVSTSAQDQFIVNFYCNSVKTRLRPMYCTPGLADHML